MPPEITREKLAYSMTRKVKWRYLSKKFDRFRREYIVWLDRNNSEPVGQVERHFTAPIDIPDEYLQFPEDKPWRVDLDLDGYARYLKGALHEWEVRYEQIKADRKASEPEDRIRQIAGPKPQDWRLVVLLSRGDPWCLGKQMERTPAVIRLIGEAPSEAQIRREAQKGPADLRLGDELEALLSSTEKSPSQFPDELVERREGYDDDEDDAELRQLARQTVKLTDVDPDGEIARRMKMDEILGVSTDGHVIADEEEAELTGDIDLDDAASDLDDGIVDLAAELEEEADPGAEGGKRIDPRKNRTRPRE